jgi:glucose/arabinose dehydrogenase
LVKRHTFVVTVFSFLLSCNAPTTHTGSVTSRVLPSGFRDDVVLRGLYAPTILRFASDGRVFVAEQRGVVRVFDSLADSTPTDVVDLQDEVMEYWDRGLLGMTLDPNFPASPYIYLLYTYDAPPGGTAPVWNDNCPTPPGATTDGCPVTGRLVRITLSGNVMVGSPQVLISNEWCQQYPSHSNGDLVFGPDGALYATGGEGASFTFDDYGQGGGSAGSPTPRNPCGDPPAGVGGVETPPTAEGGSLRSQSPRRPAGEPVVLNGTLLRIDPATGAGLPSNPGAGSSNANVRRVIAYGLRNPFRFTFRPGTSEVWIADVGAGAWEEVDRRVSPTGPMQNFGWPCYEGNDPFPDFESIGVNSCMNLYNTPGAVTAPYFAYSHSNEIVPGDGCNPAIGSAITAIAFYSSGSYPASYNGALFFGDYSRGCIWAMMPGANGLPDPTQIQNFVSGTGVNPVDLQAGPGGDLFYVDYSGGTIHRISYGNQPPPPPPPTCPNDVFHAQYFNNMTLSGTPVLDRCEPSVNYDWGTGGPDNGVGINNFSARWSGTFNLAAGTYAFTATADDGIRVYVDGTLLIDEWIDQAATTYQAARTLTAGAHSIVVEYYENFGAAVAEVSWAQVSGTNQPPVPVIDTPAPTLTWRVGDPIAFSGHATDPEQGTLPASALTWTFIIHHCTTPNDCHTHTIQTLPGMASGTVNAPDHDYPSWLELQLMATDAAGQSATASVRLDPITVDLTFASVPSGLTLAVSGSASVTPFTRTVIVNSANSISAALSQTLSGTNYGFSSWSDGGAATHNITAGATPTTYTATYTSQGTGPCPNGVFQAQYFNNQTLSGTPALDRCETSINYDWGLGGPDNGVGINNFSARWSGSFDFAAGSYVFTARADDGVRVYVDGVLVIDAWVDQAATTYQATRTLTAGAHSVVVEYYEHGGAAVAQVSWAQASGTCPSGAFRAQYFNNTTLTGTPLLDRCETSINYDWGLGGPDNGVPNNNFSTRWTGSFNFAAGSYVFTARADDGIRVYVDSVLVIDEWIDQAATTYQATRTLTAGAHTVVVEYYEHGGAAVAQVSWAAGP